MTLVMAVISQRRWTQDKILVSALERDVSRGDKGRQTCCQSEYCSEYIERFFVEDVLEAWGLIVVPVNHLHDGLTPMAFRR